MFDYEKLIDVLRELETSKEKKRTKTLRKLFQNEDFMTYLFKPRQAIPNISTPALTMQMQEMYAILIKPKVIKSIITMIQEEGYEEFTRTHSTFLYSIANLAIEHSKSIVEENASQKRSGDKSNKEVKATLENVEKYNARISSLIRVARRITKSDVKRLSRESNTPRFICAPALYSIPEVKYIDKFKIGYYLNNLLNIVYSEISNHNEFDKDIVKWRTFFRELFGKENIVEVSTFILLEGVHRIDNYKNSRAVTDAWDSLTEFALSELNNAPDALRHQMIELYIKRISKMFANKSFDLRVDMLTINESLFPKLAKTVEQYSSRIEEILTKGE